MLFAAFVLERETIPIGYLPHLLILWVQNAGAVACLGILLLWAYSVSMKKGLSLPMIKSKSGQSFAFIASVLGLLGYAAMVVIAFVVSSGSPTVQHWILLFPRAGRGDTLSVGDYILLAAGLLSLAVVTAPIFDAMVNRIRVGRIWAIALLSLKEAFRNRVMAVFGFFALIFLFADWFVPYRAEDQVRNYVRVVYWSMTPLFVLTAALLGAFSIPNDVKNQTIHTIVTKPVEKFEIVLGRYLGYGILMTFGLLLVASVSLLYVLRGVNEDAQRQSFKARVPVYGGLSFVGTKDSYRGDSVGREWGYRSYISGPQPNSPNQYAIWSFGELPSHLADRTDDVPVEFTFDIFRLSKGDEDKGIFCTFTFAPGDMGVDELKTALATLNQTKEKLQTEARRALEQDPALKGNPGALQEAVNKKFAEIREGLLKDTPIYEIAGMEVTDYKTQSLDVPAAFFKSLLSPERKVDPQKGRMRIYVSVDRAREAQMLGVARADLYLLAGINPFWLNFLKGMFGLWCKTMLVLGLAVFLSSYLNGVISFFCTGFLFIAGLFSEYLHDLATNQVPGGGPTEAFYRLVTHKVQAAPLDEGATTTVLKGADDFFSWWLTRFLNLVPDVNRFDLHHYVAEGFDIGWMSVLMMDNFLPLVGYMIPWAILAYYLMNYREIANPM